jgi:simple sugar transport system permease protein
MLAVTASTCLAALGMVFFVQSFGLVQLYSAPIMFTLPTVAAVLIGGATLRRVTIAHVIVGVTLFQSILVVAPPVLMKAIPGGEEMAEALRITIQNGMILYALTRRGALR